MKYAICLIVFLMSSFPAKAQESELNNSTQAIVDDFIEWSIEKRLLLQSQQQSKHPKVLISASEYGIFFDAERNIIAVPTWELSPQSLRDFFNKLSPSDDGEELFKRMFNEYFVAHEAAHWLQFQLGQYDRSNLYKFEQTANHLAVAYWFDRTQGEGLIPLLAEDIEHALSILSDPTPANTSPQKYFTENYQELGNDPYKYGFYQFLFLKNAIAEHKKMDLNQTLIKY